MVGFNEPETIYLVGYIGARLTGLLSHGSMNKQASRYAI